MPRELLTTSEVAAILGLTPRRIAQLADQPGSGFPQPYAITRGVKRDRGMRLWRPEDIAQWQRDTST